MENEQLKKKKKKNFLIGVIFGAIAYILIKEFILPFISS